MACLAWVTSWTPYWASSTIVSTAFRLSHQSALTTYAVTGEVEDVLKDLDPSLAKTVRGLLKDLDGVVGQVQDILDGALDDLDLGALLKRVTKLVGQITDLLNGAVDDVNELTSKDINKLVKSLDNLVSKLLKKIDLKDLVDNLLKQVNGIVGDLLKALRTTLKKLDPELAKTIRGLLGQVNKLLKRVGKVVDGLLDNVNVSNLLDEIDSLVKQITTKLGEILKTGKRL
jgi:phage-related protein